MGAVKKLGADEISGDGRRDSHIGKIKSITGYSIVGLFATKRMSADVGGNGDCSKVFR